jgi:hypothetical protein
MGIDADEPKTNYGSMTLHGRYLYQLCQRDRDRAQMVASLLEAEGYSVWWDSALLSGDKFRKVIMAELGKARAVIVIWWCRPI